jgi:competence protein ComEA
LYSGIYGGKPVEIWQFLPFPEKIRINEAGPDLLRTLPGVGEKRAAEIIEYRDTVGLFSCKGDLLSVPSIAPALLDRIRPYITTGNDPSQ